MEFKHIPIMADAVIEGLDIKPDGIYVDGTLGGAGHSSLILDRLGDGGRLIGIDQDIDAIKASSARLNTSNIYSYDDSEGLKRISSGDEATSDVVTIVKSNYKNIKNILTALGIESVNGILLDLGVSSYQFDESDRGFTYREDAPLDMRMDREGDITAADIVNTYSEEDLARVMYEYGEERFSKNIAKNIVKSRGQNPISTTGELVDIIRSSIPEREKNKKGHPAKKVFQALRIEVNHELDVLTDTLDDMINVLDNDGRLCIITFHSLEDRIVKRKFKTAQDPCICPPDFPVCTCGRKSLGRVVFKKPIVADERELTDNPRSKSAKLRVFKKESL